MKVKNRAVRSVPWTRRAAIALALAVPAALGVVTAPIASAAPDQLAGVRPEVGADGAGAQATYVQIRARHSNKCMDVEGPSTADRANIYQFTCRGTTNQHWYRVDVGDGYSEIRARHSNKCMDVEGPSTADRANIHQFTCRGTTNQHWYFVYVGKVDNYHYYEIRARHSRKCADVAGPSTADRADIYQFTCRGTTNQHWYFVAV